MSTGAKMFLLVVIAITALILFNIVTGSIFATIVSHEYNAITAGQLSTGVTNQINQIQNSGLMLDWISIVVNIAIVAVAIYIGYRICKE